MVVLVGVEGTCVHFEKAVGAAAIGGEDHNALGWTGNVGDDRLHAVNNRGSKVPARVLKARRRRDVKLCALGARSHIKNGNDECGVKEDAKQGGAKARREHGAELDAAQKQARYPV